MIINIDGCEEQFDIRCNVIYIIHEWIWWATGGTRGMRTPTQFLPRQCVENVDGRPEVGQSIKRLTHIEHFYFRILSSNCSYSIEI